MHDRTDAGGAAANALGPSRLRLRRLGIGTHQEAVIYMRPDCHVCRAEGFAAHARILVEHANGALIATLHTVSGELLELAGAAAPGNGAALAREALADGRARSKLEAICEAQGGMRKPPVAAHRHPIAAPHCGFVATIDNRRLARLAKLAGAPSAKAAGIFVQSALGAPGDGR